MLDQNEINHFREVFTSRSAEVGASISFKDFHLERREASPLGQVVQEESAPRPCYVACRVSDGPPLAERDLRHDTLQESLLGSPLKLQEFTIDKGHEATVTSDGKVVVPISINEARCLLSLYIQACQAEEATDWPPLWVLCDGRDLERTAFLGGAVDRNDGGRWRVLSTVVTVRGPACWQPQPLRDLWDERSAVIKSSSQVNCSADYRIIQRLADADDSGVKSHNTLDVSVTWNKVAGQLLASPSQEAVVTVRAQAVPGDLASPACRLYTEYCVLENFMVGLEDGVVRWGRDAQDTTAATLVDRVKQLVERHKPGGQRPQQQQQQRQQEMSTEDSKEDMTPSVKMLLTGQDRVKDFAELLWDILKDATSYEDLVDCLDHVIRALRRRELHVRVHKSDCSRWAGVVREASVSAPGTAALELTNELPLQLLCDLGVAKLRHELAKVLLDAGLLLTTHLQHFTDLEPCPPRHELAKLRGLLHTVELVVLLDNYLTLPKALLSAAARGALKHYETHPLRPLASLAAETGEGDGGDADNGYVFCQRGPMRYLLGRLSTLQPTFWKVQQTNVTHQLELHAVLQFSQQPPFSHVCYGVPDDSGEGQQPLHLATVTQQVLLL